MRQFFLSMILIALVGCGGPGSNGVVDDPIPTPTVEEIPEDGTLVIDGLFIADLELYDGEELKSSRKVWLNASTNRTAVDYFGIAGQAYADRVEFNWSSVSTGATPGKEDPWQNALLNTVEGVAYADSADLTQKLIRMPSGATQEIRWVVTGIERVPFPGEAVTASDGEILVELNLANPMGLDSMRLESMDLDSMQ